MLLKHPLLSSRGYQREVERLTGALNDPDERVAAATALRGLIDKVVITPTGR